jgi:SAM-dependent methyltransferase
MFQNLTFLTGLLNKILKRDGLKKLKPISLFVIMKNMNLAEAQLKKRISLNSNFQNIQVETFIKIIDKYITNSNNRKVLEIGCSYGFWLNLLYLNYKFMLYGIDIDNFLAPSLTDKVKFIKANGCNLPFKENTFDMIYSIDVIEHIKNDALFLTENYRVLKKNGIAILGTPNKNRLSAIIKKLLFHPNKYPLKIKDKIFGYVTHIREYNLRDLIKIVKKTKFKILEILPIYLGFTDYFDKIYIAYPKSFFKYLAQFWFVVLKK